MSDDRPMGTLDLLNEFVRGALERDREDTNRNRTYAWLRREVETMRKESHRSPSVATFEWVEALALAMYERGRADGGKDG